METLDAIVNKTDFFKGEFVKGYHDADMLEMCLGRLCHFVDYDQTSIEDADKWLTIIQVPVEKA